MDYKEILQAVIVNTNRPELLAETEQAIRRATLKMHNLDYFLADLSEGKMAITPSLKPRIDLSVFGTRFRKFAALHSSNSGEVSEPLEVLEPSPFTGNSNKAGYYSLGGSLVLQNCGLVDSIVFQFYSNPVVEAGRYDSWIATKHPYAIIDEASKNVFMSVGNAEKANYFAMLVGGKMPRPSGHVAEILSSNPIGYDSAEL